MSPSPQAPPAPSPAAAELRRSARNGAVGLAGAVASGVLGFLLAVVITRGYGTAGAGAFFTAIGVITVATAVCCLGADTGLLWALPRYRSTAGGNGAGLLRVALLPPLLLALAVGAVGAAAAPRLAATLLDPFAAEGARLLRLTFAALPGAVATAVLLAAVRAVLPIGAYAGVQFLLLPVGRPVLVGAAAALGGGTVAGMGGWLAPYAVALAACAALLARSFGTGSAPGRAGSVPGRTGAGSVPMPFGTGSASGPRPVRRDWRVFWGFALPRAVSAAIDSGSMWVGVLLTAAFAGPAQAGVFGAVGRYVLAGQLVMQGLRVALAPQLSRLLGTGRVDDAVRVHRRSTTWVIVLSWPGYLLLAVFGPGLLRLFGSEFAAGAPALVVLALAMLVNVGLGNVQTLLLMGGHSGWHLLATALGLSTTVLGAMALAPRYGALGAAVAWGGGIVVENVTAASAAQAVLGRRMVVAPLVAVAAAVASGTALACAVAVPVAGRGVAGLALAVGLLAGGCAMSLRRGPLRARVRAAWGSVREGTS